MMYLGVLQQLSIGAGFLVLPKLKTLEEQKLQTLKEQTLQIKLENVRRKNLRCLQTRKKGKKK